MDWTNGQRDGGGVEMGGWQSNDNKVHTLLFHSKSVLLVTHYLVTHYLVTHYLVTHYSNLTTFSVTSNLTR